MKRKADSTLIDKVPRMFGVKTARDFLKGVWDDLDFWINTGAVKAGASAIAFAGIAGISYVVTLPLALAAVGVVACGTLLGVGLYGIIVGSNLARKRIMSIYNHVMGREDAPEKAPLRGNAIDRLKQKTFVQKILRRRPVRKFLASNLWRNTDRFVKKRRDAILGSMALGGSVASVALGVAMIATQVMVLPIVAAGSLIVFTCYMTGRGIAEYMQKKKAANKEKPAAVTPEQSAPAMKPVSKKFAKSAANQNPPSPEPKKYAPVPPPAPH